MKNRSITMTLALVVALIPAAVFAWGVVGHTMINRLAAQSCPTRCRRLCARLRRSIEIATLGPEEDRIKDAGQSWDDDNDPGHYLDTR